MILAIPNKVNAGVFIEMKTIKGVVSENQKKFINLMRLVGYRAEVVRDFDTFMKIVNEQMKNL